MGNTKSTQRHESYEDYLNSFKFDKKCLDSRLGEIKRLKNEKEDIIIFQKDYITNSAKDYEKHLDEVKKRSSVEHSNIIRIVGYTSKTESAFCSNHYKVSTFLEFFESDLGEDLDQKIQEQTRYTETELWHILDSIVSACAHLQANNQFHGDLRPSNILLTSNKEYKILDNNIFCEGDVSLYAAQLVNLEDKGRFYSPILFSAFDKSRQDTQNTNHSIFKSDVFSLGMTILALAGFEKVDNLYNWEKFELDFFELNQMLEDLLKIYTSTLVETIRFMLAPDEEERPDFLKLDSEFAPYRVAIRTRALKYHNTEKSLIDSKELQEVGFPQQQFQTPDAVDLDKRVQEAILKSESTLYNRPAYELKNNGQISPDHFAESDNFQIKYSNPGEVMKQQQFQPQPMYLNSPQANSNADQSIAKKYGAMLSSYEPYKPPSISNTTSSLNSNVANKYGSYLSNYKPASPLTNNVATSQPSYDRNIITNQQSRGPNYQPPVYKPLASNQYFSSYNPVEYRSNANYQLPSYK